MAAGGGLHHYTGPTWAGGAVTPAPPGGPPAAPAAREVSSGAPLSGGPALQVTAEVWWPWQWEEKGRGRPEVL